MKGERERERVSVCVCSHIICLYDLIGSCGHTCKKLLPVIQDYWHFPTARTFSAFLVNGCKVWLLYPRDHDFIILIFVDMVMMFDHLGGYSICSVDQLHMKLACESGFRCGVNSCLSFICHTQGSKKYESVWSLLSDVVRCFFQEFFWHRTSTSNGAMETGNALSLPLYDGKSTGECSALCWC